MSRENDLIVLQEQTPALLVSPLPETVVLQGGTDALLLQSADPAPVVLQPMGEFIQLVETPSATTPGTSVLLVVQELDGSPSVGVSKLLFPNGTLTDNLDGSATYTPAGGGGLTGTLTAGRVPFATGAATLSDDGALTWDNMHKTLYITAPGFNEAVVAQTDTSIALDGEANGAGGYGVYGYAGGSGGIGVVAEAGVTDAIPVRALAPSGQTAHLIEAQVNGATVFDVGPSGYVDLAAAAAPPAPPSGYVRLYCDSADGHLKVKKSSGTVVDLG